MSLDKSSGKTRYVVGVDLGGTKISVARCRPTARGTRDAHRNCTRASEGADAVVGRIVASIEAVIAETSAQTGATRADFSASASARPVRSTGERGS